MFTSLIFKIKELKVHYTLRLSIAISVMTFITNFCYEYALQIPFLEDHVDRHGIAVFPYIKERILDMVSLYFRDQSMLFSIKFLREDSTLKDPQFLLDIEITGQVKQRVHVNCIQLFYLIQEKCILFRYSFFIQHGSSQI